MNADEQPILGLRSVPDSKDPLLPFCPSRAQREGPEPATFSRMAADFVLAGTMRGGEEEVGEGFLGYRAAPPTLNAPGRGRRRRGLCETF